MCGVKHILNTTAVLRMEEKQQWTRSKSLEVISSADSQQIFEQVSS